MGEPTRYAVGGVVNMDGAPAPFVIVKFIPAGGGPGGGGGNTDQSGKFAFGEDGKDTGLPSGDYKVTFSQTLVKGKPILGGGGGKKSETLRGEKEAVAEEYRNVAKTPVTATVSGGARSFTFDIKSSK
ncbi:hypothetical protein ACYOEI_16965 [Singulisphaera rosea]